MSNANAKPSRRAPLPKGKAGPLKRIVSGDAEPKPQPEPKPQADQPQATAQAPQAQPEPQVEPVVEPVVEPEPQVDDFDLDSFLAGTDDVVAKVDAERQSKERSTSGNSQSRQRVSWPQSVQKAAALAGIRLPGLFPKPGSVSERNVDGNGWYRSLPKGSGKPGEPGRGDYARELLWELAGARLASTGTLPTAQLLGASVAIRKAYAKDKAEPPEWSLYLIAPSEKRPNGGTYGHQTCLMHQITLMAGSATILRPDTISKV